MIIEIRDDGNGAWNFAAKDKADAWPPAYLAYSRSLEQVEYLVKGVLSDLRATTEERPPWCAGADTGRPPGVCGRQDPHPPHDRCARIDCDHRHCGGDQ